MNIHRIYSLAGHRFRRKRMARFLQLLRPSHHARVADLGGTARNWLLIPAHPAVTLVNLRYDGRDLCDGFPTVRADARLCPFSDRQFDIAFSNSLVEHMGTWESQKMFASEIRRLAPAYFVQTPNKWFPIEPHFLTPLVQFVPRGVKPWVLRWLTIWGWMTKPTRQRCTAMADEVRLLDVVEMKALFPDCVIIRERFLGLTKSIIAFKYPEGSAVSGPHLRAPAPWRL